MAQGSFLIEDKKQKTFYSAEHAPEIHKILCPFFLQWCHSEIVYLLWASAFDLENGFESLKHNVKRPEALCVTSFQLFLIK